MPRPCGLCDLSEQFSTSCGGLQLVNPGLDALAPGQVIRVPPCSAIP